MGVAPMKLATKVLAGRWKTSRGVPIWRILPESITAIRSAMRQGLGLVVGDEDRGHAEGLLELLEEGAGLETQPGVEVRQRLVEEEHLRVTGDGPGQGDPLLLPAGELGRPTLHECGKAEALGRLGGRDCDRSSLPTFWIRSG